MTVASFQDSTSPLASAGCSSEPLFSSPPPGEAHQLFAITTPTSSLSFDWSDFPVLSQYNEDMPVPPPAPASTSSQYYSSSRRESPRSCSWVNTPTMPWEVHDDDTTSLSISSDEDTIVESRSQEFRVKRDPNKKSVSFATVLEIRSHNVVLGAHPCCSSLALELGWEQEDAEVVDFDMYERSRCYQRRHLRALRLSYWDRRRLLEQSTGLSEEELLLQEQRAWREQLDDQEQRAWREQLDDQVAKRDRAPAIPQKTCSHEAAAQGSILKVSSMNNLSSLAARSC